MKVIKLPRANNAGQAFEILGMFSKPLDQYPRADDGNTPTGYKRVIFNGGIFTIGATHTGDMYDIAYAHTIIGHSVVIIWGVDNSSVFKAAEIARFLDDSDNVFWTAQSPPANLFNATTPEVLRDLANGQSMPREVWIREGGATTIVTAFAKTAKADMPQVAGPEVFDADTSLDAAISTDLTGHGFRTDQRYVIVNYRQSGHSGVGNAPALDTGETGFLQLLTAVRDLGLTPIPMGEIDPADLAPSAFKPGANLVKYWSWDSATGYGRRAETRLLRVLARDYKVVAAVGMRSGVTDLLCYLGIPTLTIDIHPSRGRPAKGWQRSLKRGTAFGGDYRIVSLLAERDREMVTGAHWKGAFGDGDLAAITKSLGYLVNRSRPSQWPQHPAQTAGIGSVAANIARDVCNRGDQIRRGRDYVPPTAATPPQATGQRKMSAIEELKLEMEAQEGLGVAPSQVKTFEAGLRDTREDIDLLIEWLRDDFIYRDDEVDDAIASLRDTLGWIEKILTT
jgi:hypothetical protein